MPLHTVFAHERRRKPHAAHRLNLGGNAEDGGGQGVHFVVDDKTPRAAFEQRKMRIRSVFFFAPRQNLVRRHRYAFDFLVFARVFGDLVGFQRGFIQQFVYPLMHRGDIRRDNQRARFEHFHHGHSHHGFSRPAR